MRSIIPAFYHSFLTILMTAIVWPLTAQSFVHRYRNVFQDQYYIAVRPLSDGRIVTGGFFTNIFESGLATMLDAEGNVQWSRTYNSGQGGFPWAVADLAETADGNLLALINVTDADNAYTNLVRLSAQNGTILDAQRLGDNTEYAVYNQITYASDGFILSGAVGKTAAPTGFSLLKTDLNGAIVWQRTIQHSSIKGVIQGAAVSENGHIWAAAALETNTGTTGTVGLFHFDASGSLLAAYQYKAADPDRLLLSTSIAYQPGTGPVLGCAYYVIGPSSNRPLIAQLDTEGNVQWSKVLNTQPDAYITAFMRRLPDGNLIAACGSGGVPNLGVIAKLDPSGSVQWMRDLTVNEGAETLLAANIDNHGNLYGAGIALSPLPILERKGFVFKTDDPNFEKAACCSREVPGQTIDAPIQVEAFVLNAGNIVEPKPVSIASMNDQVQRQTNCSALAPPTTWSDTNACPGNCVTLRLNLPSTQVFTLSAPGAIPATVQFSDSTTLCFPEAGEYTLLLDDGGCVRTKLTYTVRQRVPGPVTLSDTLICPGECIQPTPPEPTGPDTYVWVFQGGQPDTFAGFSPPEICYSSAGTYTVRLNIAGCGFSEAKLEVSSSLFQIPNAFTPNGDGNNDLFRPLLDCPSGEYLFEVYNRWGEKVYSSTELDAGWNGIHNDQAAPTDVYVWVVTFGETDSAGKQLKRKEKGHVTLFR